MLLKLVLYVILVALMAGLHFGLGVSLILSWLLTMVIFLGIYLPYCHYLHQKRVRLLNEQCDPEAFLEATVRLQDKKRKKSRVYHILFIDQAAAYITMGKMEEARDVLEGMDSKCIKPYSSSMMAYYINLAIAYYESGDVETGESIFENKITTASSCNNKGLIKCIEILIAKRYMIQGKYDACMEKLEQVKDLGQTSLRLRLEIAFFEGECAYATGDMKLAKKRFERVIKHGNKLYIVTKAKDYMAKLDAVG